MKISKWIVAGILSLVLVATCGLIIGITWATIGQAGRGIFSWDGFEINRVEASADDEQRFTVEATADAPAKFTLDGFAGDVTVLGGTGDTITVKMHKTAWGATQAEAEAELAALKITFTQSGDTVKVQVEGPKEVNLIGDGKVNTVDFTITLPTQTAVDMKIDFGDVTLSDTVGEVTVKSNLGDITVSNVEGDVNLSSDFGDTRLTQASAGQVDVRSNAGEIFLTEVVAEGLIALDSDFGSVTFEQGQADRLSVESNAGTVTLEGLTIANTVTVNNDFGEVMLTDVEAASYSIDANSGTVTVTGAQGAVKIHSDFGEITVEDAQAVTLDLKTNAGSITFIGSLGDGPHAVASDFGEIRLTLPAETALDIDLQTDLGNISSAFPITASGTLGNHWQGTLNGGGANLTVKTNSGSISLEILNP